MKKMYNQFTKSDMPLDNSLNLPTGGPTVATKTTTRKPRINAIGSKAVDSVKQGKTTQSKTTQSKTTQSKTGKTDLRKKLTKKDDVTTESLEKLNEQNLQTHSFRGRRNQVLIVILSIMIAICVAVIVVYSVVTKVEKNCFVYTYGDADCSVAVNGENLTEFAAPANITGNCIFSFTVDLSINSPGSYNIKLVIEPYYNGVLLENFVIYEPNLSILTYNNEGYYNTKSPVEGNQTIRLCQGVALNELDKRVDASGYTMKINIYVERA